MSIESLNDGKVIVVSSMDPKSIVPIFCSCCTFPMKSAEDSVSYRKHKVCSKCDGRWTNHPDVDWENGIGPDKTSELWEEFIIERAILARPIIKFE